jgi:oligopeptide/dipeptide ABC transporter ATP-binding protein
VHHVSDRIAVMYLGRIVELSDSKSLYETPRHPYTEALMSAIPSPAPEIKPNHILLPGEIPNPANPPTGCRFHTRCPYVVDKCRTEEPIFKSMSNDPGHFVACHRAEELQLRGASHYPVIQQRRALDKALLRKAKPVPAAK